MKQITRLPVDSSMVSAIGYDAQDKVLYVEFVNTGYIYAYYGVSEREFEELKNAGSVGRHMRNNILDFYSGHRVRQGRDLRW